MSRIVAEDIAAITSDPVIATAAPNLSGATVLVAGAGGLIARCTALALAELSAGLGLDTAVVCLVRDLDKAGRTYATHPAHRRITFVQQTLGNPLRYDGPADLIVHAGGSSSPQAYRDDPYGVAAANVRAAFDLVDLGRRRGTRRISYFSSREVYGNATAEGILHEETVGVFDHLALRNTYPEAKRMTESALVAASAQHSVRFQALRLASVYGPGMQLTDDGRAMAHLIGTRLAGQDLVLASDGSTTRAYCYVTDAVRGVLTTLLTGADDEVYNIANEAEPVSIRHLAEMLAALPAPTAGERTPQVVLGPPATPSGYSTFGYLPVSTSRIEALGWAPQVSLANGLIRTLEFFGDGG